MAGKPKTRTGTKRTVGKAVAAPSPGAVETRPRPTAGYMRDSRGPTMRGYNPILRDPYQDVQVAYTPAASRATDLMQNVGWIAGGIDQAVANCVGNGLKLNAKPDPDALRLDPQRAQEWAKLAETRFSLWADRAYECDVEGRRNFGQMQAAGYRGWHAFGEIIAEFPWRERAGGSYGTKVRLIPPQRLSQRTLPFERLIQGVYMDADGQPISYLFELPDPWIGIRWATMPARDNLGRIRIKHIFDGAIGHIRGISPMVPMIQVARQFDQLANATLMQAIVQSLFAASLESDQPTEDVLLSLLTPDEQAKCAAAGVSPFDAWTNYQSGWYGDQKDIDVGINGRIATPPPGTQLKFHASATPNGNYKDFARDLLREMARCAGITYEDWTGDYAGVTFSSIRFATDSNWRIVTYRRKNIVAPLCQAGYENWLEEEIDRGGPLALTGGLRQFLENRTGICNSEWIGTPKPSPDELKTAAAQELVLAIGGASEFDVAQAYGRDLSDIYAEKAAAMKMRQDLGLPEPAASKSATGNAAAAAAAADSQDVQPQGQPQDQQKQAA